MMRVKRALALLLTVAMALSFMVFPVNATAPCTLSLSDAEATVTASAGQDVTVDVNISGLAEGEGWSALTLYVYYNSDLLTFKDYDYEDNGIWDVHTSSINKKGTNTLDVNAAPDAQDANKNGDKDEMCVSIASTSTKNGDSINVTGNGTLWKLTFTVAKDLESQVLPLQLVCLKATVNEDTSAMPATIDGKVTVNGVTPTIGTVSLNQNEVTVNGEKGATVKAQAFSVKGTDITNGVAWSVTGGKGVSIADNGVITVDAKAEAGSYTVTAAAKDGGSQGSGSAVLTVKRKAPEAATITLTRYWTDLEVPIGDGISGGSFKVTVENQYGDEVKNPAVTWSIEPKVNGVTINENSGEVTVLPAAKKDITDTTGKKFTITATCGSAAASETIMVRRADAVTTEAAIFGADSVTIPTGDTAATTAYTVKVFDQYKDEIKNADVVWSVSQAAGVSIADGVLTVDKTAQAGNITVTAKVKDTEVTDSKTVKLQSVKFTQTAAPTVKESPVYGDAWSAIVTNLGSYSAEVGDTVINGTYSLKDADARPNAGEQTYTILFNSTDGTYKNVVVITGEVTVQPYTLTVTRGDIAVSKTYDGTTAVTADKVTGKLGYTVPLFGDENLSITYEKAEFDYATVAGASKVTFSGLKINGAAAANYKLNVTSLEVEARISRASLTIKANDKAITYGDAPADNGFSVVSGLAKGETADVVSGVSYNYNYTQGGNVGSYTITPAGGTADNYEVTGYENGKLTVSPKTLFTDAIATIASVTYNGEAQTPALTVKDGEKALVSGTDYIAEYSNNTNAGNAKVVVTGKGNYSGTAEQTFTINKKQVTVTSGITAVDREYNGETTVELDCTKAVFDGVVNNDALTVTAAGTMETVDAAQGKKVAISGLTLGGTSAGNYVLAETGNQTATTVNISKKTATELTLTAKDAAYTGVAYDAANVVPNRDPKDVVLTYYADNDGQQGDVLTAAPTAVGPYWVSGKIEETNNIAAAVAAAVKFQITKAPLTIKANDKTIVYGDAPAHGGVTYTGLVNGEDGAAVVTGLEYGYSYEQFSNAGTYTITPKGAAAVNYEIKLETGKLTVEQKEVTLIWSNAGTLYYDGTAKNVTAVVDGAVNGDEVAVTVAGGKQTAIGSYAAAATGLTGAKAGNYKLPDEKTMAYTIVAALTSVTVMPATITATIDNSSLTIKLVGYKNEADDITVSAENAVVDGDKLTINGVAYTIDKSGVKNMPAEVEVQPEGAEIAAASTELPQEEQNKLNEINDAATKGEGLNEAAADKLAAASGTITEQDKTDGVIKVKVQITLNIQPKSFEEKNGKYELAMSIEPKITYIYVKADGTEARSADAALANSDIKAPVTISIKLPSGFAPNFAKHNSEMIPVTVANGVATWQQDSFSEVTLISDARKAVLTFQFGDGHTQTVTYTAADIGKAFPTDSKSGHMFNGWSDGTDTYTSLTDALLTALNGTNTLTASFTQKSSSGGGGAAVAAVTYPVSVDKAENGTVTVSPKNAAKGDAVTITVKPDKGYELASITVLDKAGKEIKVTAKDGKYNFVMSDGKVTVKAEFAKKSVMSFADVTENDWYYSAVKYCFDNGLMNGVGEDRFAPYDTTIRAMVWTILARNASVDTSTGAVWYEAGMKWAMENKISDGTNAEGAITREQFATMLYRVAQSRGEGFTGAWYFPLSFDDAASISDWADEAMHWCVMKGILNGSNNKLNPAASASRAEVAAMLMRFLTLDK